MPSQQLVLTRDNRKALSHHQTFSSHEEEGGYETSLCLVCLQVRVIPIQLQKLFARLLLLNQQSAAVDALTTSFGWINNEVCVCACE